jgi:hypothetical protein
VPWTWKPDPSTCNYQHWQLASPGCSVSEWSVSWVPHLFLSHVPWLSKQIVGIVQTQECTFQSPLKLMSLSRLKYLEYTTRSCVIIRGRSFLAWQTEKCYTMQRYMAGAYANNPIVSVALCFAAGANSFSTSNAISLSLLGFVCIETKSEQFSQCDLSQRELRKPKVWITWQHEPRMVGDVNRPDNKTKSYKSKNEILSSRELSRQL